MNNTNIKKWALVTGASKGLGYSFCEALLEKNYNIIGVARNTNSLDKLKINFPNQEIVKLNMDLSDSKNSYLLFENCKKYNIELVINNAGFGIMGEFIKTDLEKELNMLDLNIKNLHILTKLFVAWFDKLNKGRIINIASVAGFIPGPAFASYYASKAYVLNLSVAINTELKISKSKVRLITICPGLLKTDFWKRAQEKQYKKIDSNNMPRTTVKKFAKKSLSKALKLNYKNVVVIGLFNKLYLFSLKLIPKWLILIIIYKFQIKRNNKNS